MTSGLYEDIFYDCNDSWYDGKEHEEWSIQNELNYKAMNGLLWCACISHKTQSVPDLRKVNHFYNEDNGTQMVGVTEFGFGQMSYSIDRNKIIMFGTKEELLKKFNDYLVIHKMIESTREKIGN